MNRTERRSTIPSRAAAQAQAKRRRIAVFGSLAMLAVVLIVALALASRVPKAASDAPLNAKLAVGDKAPEFDVSTTGGPFDLAQAGGKPTLLEVFATWCPHCQRETKIMNALYAKYGRQITIVAVSGSNVGADNNTPASQADVVAFAQKFGVTYPIAFDGDLKVAGAYMQTGFPTIVVIRADKTVSYVGDGELPESTLETAIKGAL